MKHSSRRPRFFAWGVATLALAGCGAAEPHQALVASSATGPRPLHATQTEGAAERLAVSATSCWMGGLWSDALGEQDNPPFNVTGLTDARTAGIERRCDAVLVDVYGTIDPMRYKQLRAIEPRVIDEIAARVRSVAGNDRVDRPDAERLAKLVEAVANAQRENVLARGLADNVKRDEEGGASSPSERASDKTVVAAALRQTAGIEALLSFVAGGLSNEGRAIGLLCALERLEIARRLPEHLKVYAVAAPFAVLFGVEPPRVPEDPTAPIRTGTWPGYLVEIAGAAGHPVPVGATEAIDRESLAWGGVLQAFADRLRAQAGALSSRTPLPFVVGRVADRLDQENAMLRARFHSEQVQRK